MSIPLCADRCFLVADLIVQVAQSSGTSERAARIAHGLTAEYVPITAGPRTWACRHGDLWPSALLAADCPCLPD